MRELACWLYSTTCAPCNDLGASSMESGHFLGQFSGWNSAQYSLGSLHCWAKCRKTLVSPSPPPRPISATATYLDMAMAGGSRWKFNSTSYGMRISKLAVQDWQYLDSLQGVVSKTAYADSPAGKDPIEFPPWPAIAIARSVSVSVAVLGRGGSGRVTNFFTL